MDDAYIGELIPIKEIAALVAGSDVNIETSQAMLHYIRDYRAEIGDVWARQEIQENFPILKHLRG